MRENGNSNQTWTRHQHHFVLSCQLWTYQSQALEHLINAEDPGERESRNDYLANQAQKYIPLVGPNNFFYFC